MFDPTYSLSQSDPQLWGAIEAECRRQEEHLELIASENYCSPAVLQASGSPDEQALALRDAMRVLFPEAVALVSAARQGFMREGR